MTQEKITKLANNIAVNQAAYSQEDAVKRIALHINMFWPPQMKQVLHQLVKESDTSLHPHCVLAEKHIH